MPSSTGSQPEQQLAPSAGPGREPDHTQRPDAPATLTKPGILHVLRQPNVARTLGLALLARLPVGAMELLLLLRFTGLGFNYAQAGLVVTCYGVAVATVNPFLSRVIDRDGQTRVLLVTALTGALATLGLALAPDGTPLVLCFAVALVAGALQPPMGGVMRALWETLLAREDERHVGYALDASATEVVFTAGPLVLVSVAAGLGGPQVALAICAALTGLGTLAFALSAPSRAWKPSTIRHADPFGPLRSPGIRTLMMISLGVGGSFGAIEVAITAYGRAHGALGLVGVLLAVWSIGSFSAGLLAARVPRAKYPAQRLLKLLTAITIGDAVLGLAPNTAVLALLLVIAGASIAPIFTNVNATMGDLAPPGTLTEAYGWNMGAIIIGATAVSPIAGLLVDHGSPAHAFAFSAVPVFLAATALFVRRRTLTPERDPRPVAD